MLLRLPLKLLSALLASYVVASTVNIVLAQDGEPDFRTISVSFGSNKPLTDSGLVRTAYWNTGILTNVTNKSLMNQSGAQAALLKSVTGGGSWAFNPASNELFKTYLYGKPVVEVEQIDCLLYDVYVYAAEDGGSSEIQFCAVTVNGINYTVNGTETVVGDGAWGSNQARAEAILGKNALKIQGLSGNLTINPSVGFVDKKVMANLAGFQIVDAFTGSYQYRTMDGNGDWFSNAWSKTPEVGTDAWGGENSVAILTSAATGALSHALSLGDAGLVTEGMILKGGNITITGGNITLKGLSVFNVGKDSTLTIESALTASGNVFRLTGDGTIVLKGLSSSSITGDVEVQGSTVLNLGGKTMTLGDGSSLSVQTLGTSVINGEIAGTGEIVLNKAMEFNKDSLPGLHEMLADFGGTLTLGGAGTFSFNYDKSSLGNNILLGQEGMTIHATRGTTLKWAPTNDQSNTMHNNLVLDAGSKFYKENGKPLILAGDIRMNGNMDELIVITGHWGAKSTQLTGKISGRGKVHLSMDTTNLTETYVLTNEDNDFSGTWLIGKTGTQDEKDLATVTLQLNANAASLASIEFAKSGELKINTTKVAIAGLDSTYAKSKITSSKVGNILTVQSGNYAGSIGNNLDLIKNGEGSLILSGNLTDFNGRLNVEGGELNLAGSSGLGKSGLEVTLGNAVLNGLTMVDGMFLNLNGGENAGLGGTTTLAGTVTVTLDNRDTAYAAVLEGGNLAGSGFTLKLAGDSSWQTKGGDIVFLSNTGSFNTAVTLEGIDQSQLTGSRITSVTAGFKDGALKLSVEGKAADLTWSNEGGNGLWDFKTSANWSGSSDKQFYQLDHVTFTDTTAGTVTIVGSLNSGQITINNSAGKDYVFTGTGSLTGQGVLIKEGAGTLRVENSNTFSGDTRIKEGAVVFAGGGSLGTGSIVSTGSGVLGWDGDVELSNALGATDGNTLTLRATSGTLTYKGTASGSVTLDKGASMNIARKSVASGSWTVEGRMTVSDIFANSSTAYSLNIGGGTGTVSVVSGSSVAEDNNGPSSGDVIRLVLGGFSGTLDVAGGLIRASVGVQGSSSWNEAMKLKLSNGAGLLFHADDNGKTLLNNMEIGPDGAKIRAVSSVSNAFIAGAITGEGNITRIDGGLVTFTGDLSGFAGKFVLKGGSIGFGSKGQEFVLKQDVIRQEKGGTSLYLNGGMTISGNVDMGEGSTLFLSGGGTFDITDSGSVKAGTLQVSDGIYQMEGSSFEKWTGLKNFYVDGDKGGGVSLNLEEHAANVSSLISIAKGGQFVLESGNLTTDILYIHDKAAHDGNDVVNVRGGILNVLSTSDSGGLVLGVWGGAGSGKLVLEGDGVVNSSGTVMVLGKDTNGYLEIGGGELNVKGISMSLNKVGDVLMSEGRLNLGSSGWTKAGNNKSAVITLNGGTVGALDDWSTSLSMVIGGEVEVDTLKRTVSKTGVSEAQTGDNAGAAMNWTGALTSRGKFAGISKTGQGMLHIGSGMQDQQLLSGFSGTMTVSEGTLDLHGNRLGVSSKILMDGGSVKNAALSSGYTLASTSNILQGGIIQGVSLSGTGTIALDGLYNEGEKSFTGSYDLNGGMLSNNWGDSDKITLDLGRKTLGVNQSIRIFTNAGAGSYDGWLDDWANGKMGVTEFSVTSGFLDDYTLSWSGGALTLTRIKKSQTINLGGDVDWKSNAIGNQDFLPGSNLMFGDMQEGTMEAEVTLRDSIQSHVVVNVGPDNTLTLVSGNGNGLNDKQLGDSLFQSSLETQSGRTILEGANNYSGGTTLKFQGDVASELEIRDAGSLGSGFVSFEGGRLIYGMDGRTLSQNNQVKVLDGKDILVDTGNNNVTWNRDVTLRQANSIVKDGSGILNMRGNGVSFLSGITVGNGHLSLTNTGSVLNVGSLVLGNEATSAGGTLNLGGSPVTLLAGSIVLMLDNEQIALKDGSSGTAAISATAGADSWLVGFSQDVIASFNQQLADITGNITVTLNIADAFTNGTNFTIDNIIKGSNGLRYMILGTDTISGDVMLSVGSMKDFVTTLDATKEGNSYFVSGYDSLKYKDFTSGLFLESESVTLDANMEIRLDGASEVEHIDNLTVNRLQSSGNSTENPYTLHIKNSDKNESSSVKLHNDEGKDSVLTGNIVASNGVDLVKTGEGTLTVRGGVIGSGIDLDVQEGTLSTGSLEVKSLHGWGNLEITGKTTLKSATLVDNRYEGSVSTAGSGNLTLDLTEGSMNLGELNVGQGSTVNVFLNAYSHDHVNNVLSLRGTSMISGTLQVTLNTMSSIPTPLLTVMEKGCLKFEDGSSLKLSAASGQRYLASEENPMTIVIAENVTSGGKGAPAIEYGTLFHKYYDAGRSSVELTGDGYLLLHTAASTKGFYGNEAINTELGEVGRSGGALLDHALVYVNPQYKNPNSTLAKVMDTLDILLDRDQLAHSPQEAARVTAAVAGSAVTALGIAQRDALRDQMGWLRNRTVTMGIPSNIVNEDMPYYNMWIEGTGSYNKLDRKGELAGYTLNSWGGTLGMDVNCNDNLTLGLAFTANYGDLKASAADQAEGDFDGYYLNLFGRVQEKSWAHTLILTGGRNEVSLDRTVNYGISSYDANGTTEGAGFGAMYELTYDVTLAEDGSSILQPLFNASFVTTEMKGYGETGNSGDAALRVGRQKLTTSSVAIGTRIMGLFGNNFFGREVLGEFRVNVSQDMGDRQGEANVGFMGTSGFNRSVRGAKMGATALQLGGGLHMPVGEQGTIFVTGNTDIRSGANAYSGSVGYRYNF